MYEWQRSRSGHICTGVFVFLAFCSGHVCRAHCAEFLLHRSLVQFPTKARLGGRGRREEKSNRGQHHSGNGAAWGG